MRYKHLLKFYFFADGLNAVLDALAVRIAVSSADCFKGCAYYAEKIARVIEAKDKLGELWRFLDGVLCSMKEGDRAALFAYATSRSKRGALKSDGEEKALHRALMAFSRRVSGRLVKYSEQVNVLSKYYCLINCRSRSA